MLNFSDHRPGLMGEVIKRNQLESHFSRGKNNEKISALPNSFSHLNGRIF